MNVFSEKVQNCTVVNIDGDIINPDDEKFREFLTKKIEEGAIEIVLDFSDVSYIDSSAVSSLLKVLRQARNHGGDIRIASTNALIDDIFEQLGLNHVFRRTPTVAEGVSSFDNP